MKWKEYCNKILNTVDNEAFYTDELQRLNTRMNRHGSEIKCNCPFPEMHASGTDCTPSFTVNLDKGTYYCNACGSKGNIITYWMQTRKVDKETAWFTIGDMLNIERPETFDTRLGIDPGLPSKYHAALCTAPASISIILSERRGFVPATLDKFCIGWDGERITIPVYDEHANLVNIRRYQWNSFDDGYKITNYTDELKASYGEDRIYGIEHLFNDSVESIVWSEGEWDRLVAEQWGLPACTGTAGANNFDARWYKLLRKKKRIYMAYDNDAAGEAGAAEMIRNLRKDVELYRLQWPADMPNKYDITDLYVKEHYTKEQFMALFVPITEDTSIPLVTLAQSTLAKFTGKRVRVPALVAGKITTPYVTPLSISATCDYFDTEKKTCSACIFGNISAKQVRHTYASKDAELLEMIDVTQDKQQLVIKRRLGLNVKCPCARITCEDYANIECVQLVPKADASFGFGKQVEYCARIAYVLAEQVQANKHFTLSGYMHANPNNQQATHIFDEVTPDKSLIEEFEVNDATIAMLKIFQPSAGQSVADKMREIHLDLERNVTYIWERLSVAYATDLVYHSVMGFTFQEQPVKRGWCECLVIGDSGQAKTTLIERLMQHYGVGELLNGETTKRTGLVYNIKQAGDAWMLNWGAMPLNDGGLLTIDELSGMPTDDLSRMSDVRSSGIAKATGVVTGETMARTRLLFISNPRSGRQLKAETYGCTAILKLFGAAEDVRRLDFAIGVASGEVSTDLVNRSVSSVESVEHKCTSEACRNRVLWAWSRQAQNIHFTDEATAAILAAATKMGSKYSSRIPLVEAADQRIKIARLSVSVACCMFSTEDGEDVIVLPAHVDFVEAYLNKIYDAKALGYDKFSAADFESNDTGDEAMQRLRTDFIAIPIATRSIEEVAAALCQLGARTTRNAIIDSTGLDSDEVRLLLPMLIKNSILEPASDGSAYYKTALGREFLESILLEPPSKEDITAARERRLKGVEI